MLRAAFFGASALVLFWDVFRAGQIARLPRAPRTFAYITASCGLLVIPAALVSAASGSVLTGRAMYTVAWLWPLTCMLFAAQSVLAVLRRMTTPEVAVPIAAYNLVIAAAAVAQSLAPFDDVLPAIVLAPEAAHANALGLVFGREALGSSWALLVPMLVPATPARGQWSRTLRSLAALATGVVAVFVVVELPAAARAVSAYAVFDGARLTERPAGDFALGLWLLPAVERAPPQLALTYDLALVDSLGSTAVAIEIAPAGATPAVLDSLARALDDLRRDSVLLVVALGYDAGDAERYAASREAYAARRLRAVDRIVRRLRPDYMLPAHEPYGAGLRALGEVPVSWWQRYLAAAADSIHMLRPRTKVGVSAVAFTPNDSLLYRWAATEDSGIDALGFAFIPSYAGAAALQARLRAAERWLRTSSREHWVFSAAENPATHGERNQARALWAVLAWATGKPRVRGLLVDGAADYNAVTGVRAPGGRLRPAFGVLRRAHTQLGESRALGTSLTSP
ncbi:MAG: hypothetical protein ACT4R6_02935 [Gemmatimonadaceae bacterium]